MGSIPNWVTTSAKRTRRSRVHFPEPRGLATACVGQWFMPGHGCRRNVQRAMVADYNPFSDQGSNVVTNHSAT